MTADNQSERVSWTKEEVPVSTLFDDPYFSLAGGLSETRHVFLGGNDLHDRLCDGFHIAELGFGTGLNLMAVVLAWNSAGRTGVVRFTTFEAYPMDVQDMARSHALFPETDSVSAELRQVWASGRRNFTLGNVIVDVITGDARRTLPVWHGRADAWFLDGFSPAKNPELWGPELMAEVARHTKALGTFATYTAAGFVRRGLQEAGFQVERVQGYGTKRHMSRGRLAV